MLSLKNERIYSLCLYEADKSDLLYQHGCIATYGGKIMAKACNTNKTKLKDKIFNETTCTCHAEINVLIQLYNNLIKRSKSRKIKRMFKKTTLYISRIKFSNNSYNSAPCKECLDRIKFFNIKRIIFYLDDDYYSMDPKDFETTHHSYGQIYINSI